MVLLAFGKFRGAFGKTIKSSWIKTKENFCLFYKKTKQNPFRLSEEINSVIRSQLWGIETS